MLQTTWNVFSQTGDIETYLLLKEIERDDQEPDHDHVKLATDESSFTIQ